MISLTYKDTIVFYDFPLVFTCTDADENLYVFAWEDRSLDRDFYLIYRSENAPASLEDIPDDFPDLIRVGAYGDYYWSVIINEITENFIEFNINEGDITHVKK
jgi:hypothetical protein